MTSKLVAAFRLTVLIGITLSIGVYFTFSHQDARLDIGMHQGMYQGMFQALSSMNEKSVRIFVVAFWPK
jgi:hypothetical protein